MARPKKERLVFGPPQFICFKPVGVRAAKLQQLNLTLDEYEAIRLADGEGLDHVPAAQQMGISRSTFSRLLVKARKKTADFLVKGALLTVEGGNVSVREKRGMCGRCGKISEERGETEDCLCPECRASVPSE